MPVYKVKSQTISNFPFTSPLHIFTKHLYITRHIDRQTDRDRQTDWQTDRYKNKNYNTNFLKKFF